MPQFSYQAINKSGETLTANIEAASEAKVVEMLSAEGLIPLSITEGSVNITTEKKVAKPLFSGLFQQKKLQHDDILALTQQMSSMLKAGLPLDKALSILIEINTKPVVNTVLTTLQQDVRNGQDFADALRETTQFSRFYVNMIRAGAAGGSIGDALERLVEYMQRAKELRSTVVAAMIYPIILFSVATLSIIALLVFVVPQFAQMFNDMGAELPSITKMVMRAGDVLSTYWWLLLVGLFSIITLIQFILRHPKSRRHLDRSMLSWPLVGDLIAKTEMAKFSRSLSTLLHNGVPLLNALEIVKRTMGNRIMAETVQQATEDLKQGESLTQSLLSKDIFPAYALHMLRVGEETGQMEELLSDVAEIYDDEVKTAVKNLLAVMEPLLILVMAMSILVIIGSVLLPMVNMADLVA
jgi:general secretion pathway protein F